MGSFFGAEIGVFTPIDSQKKSHDEYFGLPTPKEIDSQTIGHDNICFEYFRQIILNDDSHQHPNTTKNYAITPEIFEIFLGVNFNVFFTKK
jgi:hypothetical protein